MGDAEGPDVPTAKIEVSDEDPKPGFLTRLIARWSGGGATGSVNGTSVPDQGSDALGIGLSNLRRMRVEDVAIPVIEIVAAEVDTPFEELISMFRGSGFTRLPVYDGTLDTPLGLVHLKDVALHHGFNGDSSKSFDIRSLLRPMLFAPPSMPIGVLLQKMQSQRRHMALVIDEYGGTDGLVTIEDLIEQVIGEIEDEHDVEEADPWRLEAPGSYVALARAPLEEFEAVIGRGLTGPDFEEDVDTLGGLVFILTGRVPARGEVVPHPEAGVEFEILDADPRKIKRLRVRMLDHGAAAD